MKSDNRNRSIQLKEVSARRCLTVCFWISCLLFITFPLYGQFADTLTFQSPNEGRLGQFGNAVSGAGDMNNDGFADIIIGASLEAPESSPKKAGRAYTFSGLDGSLLYELQSPNEEARSIFGSSVSGAGDVNNDGFADVVIGAFGEDPGNSPGDAGRAYIFSGSDASLLYELQSANEEVDGYFGFSVSGAGDANSDGFADVIIGAYGEDPGNSPGDAGRAYIFSGSDGSLLYELQSPNERANGFFGRSVSGAGDANNDGFADVIIGASQEEPGISLNDAGRAYIFSGSDGSLLYELQSPNERVHGFFGNSVSGAGDVNSDGFADVIVSAIFEDSGSSPRNAGRAYIFSGSDGSLLYELQSPNERGFGNFGSSVSGAGDVNSDGFADVIVGANGEGPGSSPFDAGRAYIFSGSDGSLLYELQSANEQFGGFFGFSVSGAGDVNNDGSVGLLVGALQEDPGSSPTSAGRAYLFVIPGNATTPATRARMIALLMPRPRLQTATRKLQREIRIGLWVITAPPGMMRALLLSMVADCAKQMRTTATRFPLISHWIKTIPIPSTQRRISDFECRISDLWN